MGLGGRVLKTFRWSPLGLGAEWYGEAVLTLEINGKGLKVPGFL